MGIFDRFSGRNNRSFSDLSDNWEKKKQAREYNSRAREIIDDYTDRYNKTYFDTMSYASETEYRLKKHYDFKKEIVRKLQLEVEPVLQNFKKFDIDSKTLDSLNISVKKDIDISIASSNNIFSNFERFSFDTCFPNINDFFRDATEEYYEAKSNYNQAKLYKSQIQLKRDELKSIKSNLLNIRSYISDEERILNELTNKIKDISDKLDKNMKKNSFKKEESDYLKSIYKIANGISKLMSMKFLNDDFTVSNDYNKLFEKIKEINSLVEKPTLNNNELNNLLKSIGDIIVY